MVELELLEFASLFVDEARKSIKEAPGLHPGIFSSRQSQAIGSLGITRILRKRDSLSVKDLVTLAVITTPPRGQIYAEMIALRILLGYNKIDKREQTKESLPVKKTKAIKPQVKFRQEKEDTKTVDDENYQNIVLKDILQMLQLRSSVDFVKHSSTLELLDQIQQNLEQKNVLDQLSHQERFHVLQTKLTFEILGGRMGILNKQLTNWDEFFEEGRNEIIRQIPSMNEDMLITSYFLENLDEINQISRNEKTQQFSELLTNVKEGNTTSIDDFSDLFASFNEVRLSKANELLQNLQRSIDQFNLDTKQVAPGLPSAVSALNQEFRNNAQTLGDILKEPDLFRDNLDYSTMKDLIKNSINYSDPIDLLREAEKIDNLLNTNLSNFLYDGYPEIFDDIQLEEILDNSIASANWLDLFDNRMNSEIKQSSWNHTNNILKKALDEYQHSNNPNIQREIKQTISSQISKFMEKSSNEQELRDAVEFCRTNDFNFNANQIRQKGIEVGMNQKEISELIGDIYDIILSMIQSENPSAGEIKLLLQQDDLSHSQLNNIVGESYKHQQAGALGAMIDTHLSNVINNTPDTDAAKNLFDEAAGIGAGPNLIKQWFMNNNNLPDWMRYRLKQMAKQIMIDQAKKKASQLIGSSEAGGIPEGSTRPYIIGDDPDMIDLEESIDNILSLGKNRKNVEITDLIVRKNVSGRRCVVFLIDISGSMSGAPLGAASTVAVMLMFAFSRDELGLALFESNTHVLCEVNEQVDIDELTDEILSLHARGGTQMSAALRWAEKQFNKASTADKMLIMLTDAMIADFNNSQQSLQNIADTDATSVLIVPEQAKGVGSIQNIVEKSNGQLLTIGDWEAFPELISEILSR